MPVSYFFFVESQDPKGKNKFELTPAITAIAGDGIPYDVVCSSLHLLDSSLEV